MRGVLILTEDSGHHHRVEVGAPTKDEVMKKIVAHAELIDEFDFVEKPEPKSKSGSVYRERLMNHGEKS